MRQVTTGRQIQKLVKLFSIRVRPEVLVGMDIHGQDNVKAPTSNPLKVELGKPILDL